MLMKMSNCDISRVLERGGLMPYHLCRNSGSIFIRSDGIGCGQIDVDKSSATVISHKTPNLKPRYTLDGWVYLNMNQHISIQYVLDYGVVSHK